MKLAAYTQTLKPRQGISSDNLQLRAQIQPSTQEQNVTYGTLSLALAWTREDSNFCL